MSYKKQSKSKSLLSNLTITGMTPSGEVKKLDIETIPNIQVHKKKDFEEEYLLINKLPEAGVDIKARLKNGGPSELEKMLFMLGETTFALSLMTKPEKSQASDIEHFKRFMEGFIEGVVKYHE